MKEEDFRAAKSITEQHGYYTQELGRVENAIKSPKFFNIALHFSESGHSTYLDMPLFPEHLKNDMLKRAKVFYKARIAELERDFEAL